jgi:hypothetical protein
MSDNQQENKIRNLSGEATNIDNSPYECAKCGRINKGYPAYRELRPGEEMGKPKYCPYIKTPIVWDVL